MDERNTARVSQTMTSVLTAMLITTPFSAYGADIKCLYNRACYFDLSCKDVAYTVKIRNSSENSAELVLAVTTVNVSRAKNEFGETFASPFIVDNAYYLTIDRRGVSFLTGLTFVGSPTSMTYSGTCVAMEPE